MNKDTIAILHILFVLALYAGSVTNLLFSIPNRDTYCLAMAIYLYIMACKHEKSALEENKEEK